MITILRNRTEENPMTIRYTPLSGAIIAACLYIAAATAFIDAHDWVGYVFAAALWALSLLHLWIAARLHLAGRVVTGRIRLPWQRKVGA